MRPWIIIIALAILAYILIGALPIALVPVWFTYLSLAAVAISAFEITRSATNRPALAFVVGLAAATLYGYSYGFWALIGALIAAQCCRASFL